MLEIVEDVLPISGAEWEVVETRHYAYYSNMGTYCRSTTQEVQQLGIRTAIPTGSPNIPPNIANATCIQGLIIEKTEGATGSVSDGFGLALGPDDQDDELDDKVSSINQGDDAALGVMYGEDSENGANGEDGAQHAAEEGTSANAGVAASAAPQAVPRPGSSHRRSATPTPLTNRKSRPRVNNNEPSFNEVMTMFLRQQQEDRLLQQEEQRERQRMADAQMQMQQTFMNSMMLMMMNSTGANMPGQMNVMPFANGMMPQLNAMPRAPMDNATFGHQDGEAPQDGVAPQAPMDRAINQQDVGKTGGDDGDQLEGLTHAEQCRVHNQMRLEVEERSSQGSRELMEEAIRKKLSREEAEGMDPEFGI
jgi:hypothetical protein